MILHSDIGTIYNLVKVEFASKKREEIHSNELNNCCETRPKTLFTVLWLLTGPRVFVDMLVSREVHPPHYLCRNVPTSQQLSLDGCADMSCDVYSGFGVDRSHILPVFTHF